MLLILQKSPVVVISVGALLVLSNVLSTRTATADEVSQSRGRSKETIQLFDGISLKGWKVARDQDFEQHGKVEIVDGAMVLGTGKPATGVVYQRKFPKNNYEITLQAKRIEGDDFFCGLTFPVGESHCTLILGGWGGGVTGLSNIDDLSAVDNETTGYVEFKQGQWYRVKVRVTDERITAWLDEDEIADVKRNGRKFSIWWEQEPMRPFGVATWRTKGAVRNVQLKMLGPKIDQ